MSFTIQTTTPFNAPSQGTPPARNTERLGTRPQKNRPRRIALSPLLAAAVLVALAVPTSAWACDGGKGHGQHPCPLSLEGVKATSQDLPNGAQLTITSDKKENVTLIHAWAARRAAGEGCGHPWMKQVTISAETLPNGARLTLTSSDKKTVARVQEMIHRKAAGEACGDEACHHEKGTKGGCKHDGADG